MEIKEFFSLPESAKKIRKQVFVEEQGFTVEFDDIDKIAVHLVAFDGSTPVATCRIFKDCKQDCYVLGRIAVIKEYRGKKLGAKLIAAAEKHIKENGGNCIIVHAQLRVKNFYKKAGFVEFGDLEYEDGCPHIRMKKYL